MDAGFRHCVPVAAGVLALLVVAGAACALETGAAPGPGPGRGGEAGERTVIVYSFHGTLRCKTCLLVEQGTEEAIRGEFADHLLDGSLSWRSVNIRLPENQHFAAEYRVASWGLVLVGYHGDTPETWRKLSLAGELAHADPDAFRRYVTAEVRGFLSHPTGTRGEGK